MSPNLWKVRYIQKFTMMIQRLFPTSLKYKLIVFLLLTSLIPLLLVGAISYYSLHSFIENRLENAMEKNLERTKLGIENTLNNLNFASGPLALNGEIGFKIDKYIHTEDIAEKFRMKEDITHNLLLINFTNQNLGNMFYFLKDSKTILFENQKVSEQFVIDELPHLTSKKIQFRGPHRTSIFNGDYDVFSIIRIVTDSVFDNYYVYIETNSNVVRQLMTKSQYGIDVSFLLINDENKVVYTEPALAQRAPAGYSFVPNSFKNDYYLFEEKSNQGWEIVAAVQKKTYNKEVYNWLLKFSALGLFSIILSLFFAWKLWRAVYRPIRNIGTEFELMSKSNFKPDTPVHYTNTIEFDRLLDQFYEMKGKIAELILQNEQKERDKRNLEIEKLVSQINPHFLYNTLNTVQWLAREKGNHDVVRLVSILIRLLQYNLGKNGPIVLMEKELEALRDYVELQRIRYEYDFKVVIEADPLVHNVLVPRFFLQPLVENALYHGLDDEAGTIHICIERDKLCNDGQHYVSVTIQDNGSGMTQEQISRLFREHISERDKVGLGIGLQYVRKTLIAYYGDDVSFDIESQPKEGTIIRIRFADKLKEE